MLGRWIGCDLTASFLQTTFCRCPERRIVVNNMHEPRQECLPEYGPPVGIATLASMVFQDQVNDHAVVEPRHPRTAVRLVSTHRDASIRRRR